ncbi:MAG: DUF3347 domain-containing protein [Candidatus Eisenbacteria bacterium]|nr:DUF3347 domain-containing protein [Candidatus Eisenbacteria bacterium]
MFKHNSRRIPVAPVFLLAVLSSAVLVAQAFAQACPKTCPMMSGEGSTVSCILAKSDNSGKFIKPYFEMRSLLARDKFQGTGSLAKKLAANAKRLRTRLKKDKAPSEQLDAVRKIESAASGFRATNLAVARERFKSVSRSVVKYVQGFGHDGPAYVYYCDMAKAAWVQETEKMGNPYHGPKMPRCGTLVGRVVNGQYDAESATPIKIEGETM